MTLVEELHPLPELLDVFRSLSRLPHCLFLDSALRDGRLGRYSFVCADPFNYLELPATNCQDALGCLERLLTRFDAATIPELPPFQGGAAGLLSYGLCHQLERIPRPRFNEFQLPTLACGVYDVVVAFDHLQARGWIVSQGFPETDSLLRRRRAASRLQQFQKWIRERPADVADSPTRQPLQPIPLNALAPQFDIKSRGDLKSNFSRDLYLAAVERAIEYIHAGDMFQVNLSQRLLSQAREDAISLYLRLREENPAPFAGYFDLGDFQILSASPERFLRVTNRQVEARPIKGTRQRTATPEADLFAADELRQSEKDRAENLMIVDLMRNDLSRVCEPESVQVTQLCELEAYQYVHHLVSAIVGKLESDRKPIDLLRAAFPGGSITGAPKVRAMQIISELEPTARGAYCGSLGYVGFDGSLDFSILIRTLTAGRGWWQIPVGGGIVAQSNPRQEYEETWHKAEGMLKALP